MPVDSENLDDLRWADMVLTIRRRIPAASAEKWTLHAPVDPGITLLDLFAWLLEQRVYTMNLPPDALSRSAMSLLGESPKTAVAATTVMRFDDVKPEVLPQFTTLQLADGDSSIVFSTIYPIALIPIASQDETSGLGPMARGTSGVSLLVNSVDQTLDLQQGPFVELFPADGSAAEIRILLNINGQLPPAGPDALAGLLFDLTDTGDIEPEWSPTAVAATAPVTLTWSYSGKGGTKVPLAGVIDGTGGFRRSGVVRFPVPADWQSIPTDPAAPSAVGYAIWIDATESNFTFPPRLARLIPNAVIARNFHKRPARTFDAPAWLPLPGQTLDLSQLSWPDDGLPDLPPLVDEMVLQIRERDGSVHPWAPVGDLITWGPGDRVFVLDRPQGTLLFGDGLTGRIPRLAADAATNPVKPLSLSYTAGGGIAGNVGTGLQWVGAGTRPDLAATNLFQSQAGADDESISDARQRVGSELGVLTRAVLAGDYESLSVENGAGVWVARAHAAVGVHPGFTCPVPGCVSVFIVPGAPRGTMDSAIAGRATFIDAPEPDAGLMAAVRTRLDAARLIATQLFVLPPIYRQVEVAVTVSNASADPNSIRKAVHQRLRDYLDPLIGGDDGNGWPFGEPLRPSTLLRETQAALGTEGDAVGICVGLLDQDVALECCQDVPINPNELVVLRRFSMRFAASSPSQGGLT